MRATDNVMLRTMKKLEDYPAGLIGTITALFGRDIAASHRVDWTLDVMIAEAQCEFFRRFDPARDRVWIAMEKDVPRGAITIEGPRPESGRNSARLRFFILDEALRGLGLGRKMVAEAMRFCHEQGYERVYLTTLPGLDAAMRLYREQGFVLVAASEEPFHGSRHTEQTLEWTYKSAHNRKPSRIDG